MKFADFQTSSTFELDGKILSACEKCRMDYAEKEPPCDTCRVELAEGNEEAAEVYMMVRGQIISLGERVVDLSIPAVQIILDQLKIKDQRETMAKIFRTFHHFLNKQRKECE